MHKIAPKRESINGYSQISKDLSNMFAFTMNPIQCSANRQLVYAHLAYLTRAQSRRQQPNETKKNNKMKQKKSLNERELSG